MRKRLVAALVVIAVVAAILVLRWRRVHTLGTPSAAGGSPAGVDHALSPFESAFDAPDGGTPCETAYNAYRALDERAKEIGKHPPWTAFPDRNTFLARCGALPPQEQQCYQPRYAAQNHPVCDPVFKKYLQHNPLWN